MRVGLSTRLGRVGSLWLGHRVLKTTFYLAVKWTAVLYQNYLRSSLEVESELIRDANQGNIMLQTQGRLISCQEVPDPMTALTDHADLGADVSHDSPSSTNSFSSNLDSVSSNIDTQMIHKIWSVILRKLTVVVVVILTKLQRQRFVACSAFWVFQWQKLPVPYSDLKLSFYLLSNLSCSSCYRAGLVIIKFYL